MKHERNKAEKRRTRPKKKKGRLFTAKRPVVIHITEYESTGRLPHPPETKEIFQD
jgi:hypothetical protein